MLVKDIYGGSYGSLGLTGDLIASSFGKSATADKGDANTATCHLFLYIVSRHQHSILGSEIASAVLKCRLFLVYLLI